MLDLFPNAPGTTTSDTLALYEDDGHSTAYERGAFSHLPLHYTANDEALHLRAEPVEGSYAGMPEMRSFTVRVRFALPPREVALDGAALPAEAWSWNEDGALLTIPLGPRPVRQGWTVNVKR